MTVSELFFKVKGREDGILWKVGGTEVACRRRSDLQLGVLLDSADKWGLERDNGRVGKNG